MIKSVDGKLSSNLPALELEVAKLMGVPQMHVCDAMSYMKSSQRVFCMSCLILMEDYLM